MSETKIFTCDVPNCKNMYQETIFGEGAKNFGQFKGIILNDIESPIFCEGHRAMVANFVDSLSGEPLAINIFEG